MAHDARRPEISGSDLRGDLAIQVPAQAAVRARRRRRRSTIRSGVSPRAAAAAEKGGKRARERWAGRFHDAMADFGFLPGGRILAGAGTGRDVTLFNCFVMGRIEDDLGSIFDNVQGSRADDAAGRRHRA